MSRVRVEEKEFLKYIWKGEALFFFFRKVIGQISCLSHTIQASQVSLSPGDPLGSSTTLPIGATGNISCMSLPS